MPTEVDPDAWLSFASRRLYQRRVTSNGSIQVGGHRYYIVQSMAKQLIAVQVRPQEKTAFITVGGGFTAPADCNKRQNPGFFRRPKLSKNKAHCWPLSWPDVLG